MRLERDGSSRRTWLTALLGAYILLQFGWWSWLLVRQRTELLTLQDASVELIQRSSWMIVGEGLVFLALLTWGFIVIWQGIRKEQEHARRERHFLIAVTHELKTPIAGARLAVETLQKHALDPETRAVLLEDVNAGLSRLEQRIENILQNNRLISGKALTKQSFDPEEMIQEVLKRHLVGPHKNRLVEIINEGEPSGLLRGDSDAISLAWGNLLENALKYSPSSEPIRISLGIEEGMHSCQFDDGGPGIPTSERHRVLGKFARLPDAEETGTGLGLYLAHQIIRMHDGKMTIESSQRGGCLFTTLIPLQS